MSEAQEKSNIKSGPFFIVCLFACAILLAGGKLYRKYAVKWQGPAAASIKLPVPFMEFPMELKGWQGQESPIPATTESYMRKNFADDFLYRLYKNVDKMAWVNLYVVYCSSRPASILGHRPRICYKGNGWIHDSTEKSTITSSLGRKLACLIHRFHKIPPNYQEIVVLNFYVANGKPVVDEDSFVDMLGRHPNIKRDFRRYVSQVQISSSTENNIRTAATDLIDEIFEFLPDTD